MVSTIAAIVQPGSNQILHISFNFHYELNPFLPKQKISDINEYENSGEKEQTIEIQNAQVGKFHSHGYMMCCVF